MLTAVQAEEAQHVSALMSALSTPIANKIQCGVAIQLLDEKCLPDEARSNIKANRTVMAYHCFLFTMANAVCHMNVARLTVSRKTPMVLMLMFQRLTIVSLN